MATVKTETTESKNKYDQEKYLITLPLTSEKQDDVTVVINGHVTKIQRGEEVEVSAGVYEVLQNSARMDNLALQRRKSLEDR